MEKNRKQQIFGYIEENEKRLKKCLEGKEKQLLLGKKLSLLSALLSEMAEKDPFRIIVEMLKKEVEEKFYQK